MFKIAIWIHSDQITGEHFFVEWLVQKFLLKIHLLVFLFAHRWTWFDCEFVLGSFLLSYNVELNSSGFQVNGFFVAIDDLVFGTDFHGTYWSNYIGPDVRTCVQYLDLLANLSFGCSPYSPSWFDLDPNEFRIYNWIKGARWSIIESICYDIIIRRNQKYKFQLKGFYDSQRALTL